MRTISSYRLKGRIPRQQTHAERPVGETAPLAPVFQRKGTQKNKQFIIAQKIDLLSQNEKKVKKPYGGCGDVCKRREKTARLNAGSQTVKKPFREVWRAKALQMQSESGDMCGGFGPCRARLPCAVSRPGAPRGREGNGVNLGKGRRRRTFSTHWPAAPYGVAGKLLRALPVSLTPETRAQAGAVAGGVVIQCRLHIHYGKLQGKFAAQWVRPLAMDAGGLSGEAVSLTVF